MKIYIFIYVSMILLDICLENEDARANLSRQISILEDTNPVSWSCLYVSSSLHAFIEFSLPLKRHATVMMMCDINSIEICFSYINTRNRKKRKILLWRHLLQVFFLLFFPYSYLCLCTNYSKDKSNWWSFV